MIVEPELDQAERCGTEDHARCDEHDWCREDRPLQPARNEAEGEDDAGKDDEVNHRRLQESGMASSHRDRAGAPLF